MRYVCYKRTITRIYDSVLDKPEDIKRVLQLICDKDVLASFKFSTGLTYEKVKVLQVNDESFRWRFVKGNYTLDKMSNFSEIDRLDVEADSGISSMLNPADSRWSAFDIS